MKNPIYTISKNKGYSGLFVLGDTHGDLESLEKLISKAKDGEKIITLGDYADRGPKGIEVIDYIKKLQQEKRIIPLKGNHEDYSENGEPSFAPCDLRFEARQKKGDWHNYFEEEYFPFIASLYTAAILPGELLFVHGGICDKIENIKDIETYEQFILWADPSDPEGMGEDYRTGRPHFGPDVSKKVCENLNVKKIIRSHEPDKTAAGPCLEHDGRIITTSATTCYAGATAFALRINLDKPQKYEVIFSNSK